MKIFRLKDKQEEDRKYGRKVRKVIEFSFSEPVSDFVAYYVESPNGMVDGHYHTDSEELIVFPIGGQLRINGELILFDAWDSVMLHKGDIHELEEDTGRETIHFALKFPGCSDKVSK